MTLRKIQRSDDVDQSAFDGILLAEGHQHGGQMNNVGDPFIAHQFFHGGGVLDASDAAIDFAGEIRPRNHFETSQTVVYIERNHLMPLLDEPLYYP